MLDSLGTLQRTHYCGNLRASDADKDVVLMGWVHRRRDLGTLLFIDLRDRSGLAQIVFNKELHAEAHARAEELRSEFVVAVIGRVVKRQKVNPDLTSGEVEIIASELRILNTAKTPPFVVEDDLTANEETRLRYRYLDLRRTKPRQYLALRHRVILEIRKAMDEMGFYEIETPMLTRSTPEGARDYLVPSRVHPGQFYALPQSPQIFKQILMIGGMDRYFQIVKCFRDEDLRADRQPEFTQLDLEISFPTQDTVFGVIENVMVRACTVAGITVKGPFRRMEYKDAIRRYGSDKPDLRFGMELHDVTEHFAAARETLHIEGSVQAFAASGAATFSRKQLDEIAEKAKSLGARGVYTVKVTAEGVTSPLEKNLGAETLKKITASVEAKPGDLVVAVSAKEQIPGTDAAALIAGQLRLLLADQLKLIPKDRWEFLWITGFALFEWSTTEKAVVSAQHPFTGIVEEDISKLEDPSDEVRLSMRSKGYDLVLNGVELGSGSIRIHQQELQDRVFKMLGLTEEQRRARFGFFLDALMYGTPPHGGIALGLDRVVALLAGEKSIREVIAFPKTAKAQDLMAEAPSTTTQEQVDELNIIPAYGYLGSIEKDLISLNDRLLSFIDRDVAGQGIRVPDPPSPWENMCLLMLPTSFKFSRGVVLLAKSGYGQQAQGLVRSLFEAAVNLDYASKDPKRSVLYWRSGAAARERFERKVKQHGWPEAYLEILESKESERTEDEWGSISLREKAKEVGLLWQYDFIYGMSSERIHLGPAHLVEMVKDITKDEYFFGPSPAWVRESLVGCFVYTHSILNHFLTTFKMESQKAYIETFPKEFHEITERFKKEINRVE